MEQIVVGIVLYQPNLQCLEDNINAIAKQVEYFIIVDNASDNTKEIVEFLEKMLKKECYQYIYNSKNLGIAKALNQIVFEADKKAYDWVLTLDQDSICPDNLISEYKRYLHLDKVGMLAPIIVDRNVNDNNLIKPEIKETKRCITSGSLLKIEVFRQVGNFNEKFFIDYVDFEYNIRMQNEGYKIYIIGSVSLSHQLGDSCRVMLAGKETVTTNHVAFRRYYNIRNRVYCAKKYKEYVDRKATARHIVRTVILIFKYEKNKTRKIVAIFKGAIVGLFMR